MTYFGWKRKIGTAVKKNCTQIFQDKTGVSENDSDDEMIGSGEIDWLQLSRIKKKSKTIQLEDGNVKSERLKHEGSLLAEAGRYWEALRKWDEAIELTPTNAILYEIKAQALMELNEVFPAVQMAEKAVMLSPTWWVAYQTLGRTQLGLGELQMAIISFSKALHLNPSERELWEMDLKWVCDLQKTKERNNLDNKEDHNDEEEKETVIISNNAVKAR